MKLKLTYIGLFLFVAVTGFGQKGWLEVTDGGEFAPDKEVKLYIDIKACDCQKLIGTTDPVYMWTWSPGSDDDRPADLKNGDWTASNPNLEMTNEGNDVWELHDGVYGFLQCIGRASL